MLPARNLQIRQVNSSAEKEQCYAIRFEVFCSTQGVPPEIEQDGREEECLHFLAISDGIPAGTVRLRPLSPETVKLERLAVMPAFRGRGIGKALITACLQEARIRGFGKMKLHAQSSAVDLYKKMGFTIRGESFYEADIQHFAMEYGLDG